MAQCKGKCIYVLAVAVAVAHIRDAKGKELLKKRKSLMVLFFHS